MVRRRGQHVVRMTRVGDLALEAVVALSRERDDDMSMPVNRIVEAALLTYLKVNGRQDEVEKIEATRYPLFAPHGSGTD